MATDPDTIELAAKRSAIARRCSIDPVLGARVRSYSSARCARPPAKRSAGFPEREPSPSNRRTRRLRVRGRIASGATPTRRTASMNSSPGIPFASAALRMSSALSGSSSYCMKSGRTSLSMVANSVIHEADRHPTTTPRGFDSRKFRSRRMYALGGSGLSSRPSRTRCPPTCGDNDEAAVFKAAVKPSASAISSIGTHATSRPSTICLIVDVFPIPGSPRIARECDGLSSRATHCSLVSAHQARASRKPSASVGYVPLAIQERVERRIPRSPRIPSKTLNEPPETNHADDPLSHGARSARLGCRSQLCAHARQSQGTSHRFGMVASWLFRPPGSSWPSEGWPRRLTYVRARCTRCLAELTTPPSLLAGSRLRPYGQLHRSP